MPRPITLSLFGGSTLDSTATLDANSNIITGVVNDLGTYSNPVIDNSGTPDFITLTFAAGLTISLSFGLLIYVKIANTVDGGAVTCEINGLPSVAVTMQDGSIPPSGSLVAGGVYPLVYDGANFQVTGGSVGNILGANNNWTGNNSFEGSIEGFGVAAAGLVDMSPDAGSFTLTYSGFSGTVSGTAVWSKQGNQVTLYLPAVTGTSNATTFGTSALPAEIQPARGHGTPLLTAEDNSALVSPGVIAFVQTGGGGINFQKPSAALFTASGTKGLPYAQTITYFLN